MGGGASYKQVTGPWEGVDYRPNNLERDDNAAGDMLNAHITPDNLITQRSGTISAGSPPFAASPKVLNSSFQGLTGFLPAVSQGISNLVSGLPPCLTAIVKNGAASNIAYTVPVTVTLFATTASIGLVLQVEGTEFHLLTYDINNNLTSDISVGYGTEATPVYTLAQLSTLLSSNGIGTITGATTAVLNATSIVAVGPFDTRINRIAGSASPVVRIFQVWNPTAILAAADNGGAALNLGTFDATNDAGPNDSVTWNQTTTYFTYKGQLWKYDGVRAYTPAPPTVNPKAFGVSQYGGTGSVEAGLHNYAFQLRYYDANGGFIDGPLITNSGFVSNATSPPASPVFSAPLGNSNLNYFNTILTGGAGTRSVPVQFSVQTFFDPSQFPNISIPSMGFASPGTTTGLYTLTGMTGHAFVPGDQIIIQQTPTGAGGSSATIPGVTRARVASVTSSTITVDGAAGVALSPVTPNNVFINSSFCSRNFTLLVWRTKVGGSLYYYSGEITADLVGGTSSYLDVTLDAALGAAYVPPSYVQGSPSLAGFSSSFAAANPYFGGYPLPYFKYITVHAGLLVAASGNTVFYTLAANLDTWSADQNSFTVPTVANEQIRGLKSFGDTLYIWTDNSMYQVTGTLPQPGSTDTSFKLSKISGSIGCINNKSITVVEERLVWMDQTGLYSLTPGSYPVPIDEPLRPLYLDIAKTSGGPLLVDTGRACYDPQRKLFFCSLTTQSRQLSQQTIMLVWNLVRGGLWEVWSNLNTVGGNVLLPGYGPLLISNTGALVRFSDGDLGMPEYYLAADGLQPIPFMFTGPQEEMGAPSVSKAFTRFRVLSPAENGTNQAFTLNVLLQRNYSSSQAGFRVMDFNSTAGFGQSVYGVDPLGDPSKDGLNMKPLDSKARAMQPVFTHNKLYEKVRIEGWEYEISPDFKQNKGSK